MPMTIEAAADAMHAYLSKRGDSLFGCAEETPEEAELGEIIDMLNAYEAAKAARGKTPTP
jgi:hypothetical protein